MFLEHIKNNQFGATYPVINGYTGCILIVNTFKSGLYFIWKFIIAFSAKLEVNN